MYQKPEKDSRVKAFGLAADYYRIRCLRVLEERPADLEWRDDILYRSKHDYKSTVTRTYRLQIVLLDNTVREIAHLKDKKEARKRIRTLKDDLRRMTKMEFDEKYGIECEAVLLSREERLEMELLQNSMLFTGITTNAGDR